MPDPANTSSIPSGKSLFSRHYLEAHLPRHAEWAEDPQPAFERLAELWERGQRLGPTWNENQTETEFLRPALEALGWAYIPQVATTRGGRLSRPDYALFRDAEARDEAYPLQGQDDAFYGRSLVIAEAKHWGRPLSRQSIDGREQWDASTNPSHQMVNYLVGTRCSWGILTNGQVWRLYSRETSSTASEFYEVDLAAVFAAPPGEGLDAFKLWWLFFRRDAFIPDREGRNFVQRVTVGSATYAREVSDKLKDLVYREVMPEVAAGFIAYRREQLGITAETDATLAEIYRSSLGLLYKLLFILYAEARGLLPVDNPAYREESLTRMAGEFAQRLDRGLPLSDATHAARRYDSLQALFHRIDLGDSSLGIPRYDGGLFNPATPENRFLADHKLSDRVVARAVDILVRDAGEPVDYGYISVRNLGSIYEGLLENRLVLATPTESPAFEEVGPRAGISLLNDRGERKATGSYYTPDYIVDYIVRQTLGPVLDERQPAFEAAMGRVADLRGILARTMDAGTVRLLRGQLDAAEAVAREAFLGIKCCDPAMGSGHFLVNAVDFLTDGIIQRMQAYHDEHTGVPWEWNPIHQLVGRVRRDIVEEMARQEIGLDPARLDDTSLLTRLVMKRCIYGVDLNRMAVELAKLSLWLHSFTVGAPLSFLDHHLRWGNSLIGADVRSVEAAIAATDSGQLGLFAGPFAGLLDLTAVMTEVAGRADATLADVRQSADEFDALQRGLTPYKQALDLWVSRHFDNAAAEELLTVHGADVLPSLRGERGLAEKYQAAIERARALWEEKRFFHWDLEFPEVFVDLARRDWAENPGFDAVIGNPPYVSVVNIDGALRKYLLKKYQTATGRFDLYLTFDEKAIASLREGGMFGFIQPIKFAIYANGKLLREMLLRNTKIEQLLDVSQSRVFPDPSTYPCVPIVRKSLPDPEHLITIIQPPHDRPEIIGDEAEILRFAVRFPQARFLETPEHVISPRLLDDIWRFIKGVGFISDPLGEAFDIEQCIRIGSEAKRRQLILAQSEYEAARPSDRSVCRRILDGKDIERYAVNWDGNWLRYVPSELYNPKTLDVLDAPKLLIKRIASYLTAVPDVGADGTFFYPLNTVYALVPNEASAYSLYYVNALLNSRFLDWYYKLLFETIAIRGGYIEYREYLKYLPLRKISFTTPAANRARYIEETRRLYEQFGAAGDPASILAFVEHHLAQGQTDVVHDLLAFLAEQMIAMNKAKQAEVKGFLAWLSRETGAAIDTLNNKTALHNYLGDYQKDEGHATVEDLLAVLRQNRRKLAVDPSSRAFQERFAAEHTASLAVLLPLKRCLAATDRLIDQVVYRLYGLTDHEIAIVEGHHA